MAILRSNGILITDGIPTHTPTGNQAVLALIAATGIFYHFDGTLPWNTLGSAVTDGDKGSITVSGSGATWTIDAQGVTLAMLQNISTDKILGRISAGSGIAEEINFTDQAQQLVDDVSFSAMRTTLGLAIGIDVQAFDAGLAALSAFNQSGFIVETANDTFAARAIDGTANEITVTGGDGGSGNPVISLPTTVNLSGKTSFAIPVSAAPTVSSNGQIAVDTTVTDFSHGIVKVFAGEELGIVALPISEFTAPLDGQIIAYNAANDEFELITQATDATLAALAAYNTNGLVTQTAADAFTGRTIIGTANEITVTNGDGVSGNPTISLASKHLDLLLNQTGVAEPTITETHINTTGFTVTPVRTGVGVYEIGLSGAGFTALKTNIQAIIGFAATGFQVKTKWTSATKVEFKILDAAAGAVDLDGDMFIAITIRP